MNIQRNHTIQNAINKISSGLFNVKRYISELSYHHSAPNNPSRVRRIERRQAMASVIEVLFINMDYETFNIGFEMRSGSFYFHEVKQLAELAGLSVSSAIRAFQTLVKAGYIETSRRYKTLPDGSKRAIAWFKRVTMKLWKDIGMPLAAAAQLKRFYKEKRKSRHQQLSDREQLTREAGIELVKEQLAINQRKNGVKVKGGFASAMFKRVDDDKQRQATASETRDAWDRYEKDKSKGPAEHLRDIIHGNDARHVKPPPDKPYRRPNSEEMTKAMQLHKENPSREISDYLKEIMGV